MNLMDHLLKFERWEYVLAQIDISVKIGIQIFNEQRFPFNEMWQKNHER